MSRILAALALCALAAGLHLGFCEWRRIEFDAANAAEAEALALGVWERVLHPAGNAAAWDARRDWLRAYHGDWVACWDAEPELVACSGAAPPGENATVKAVKRIECAELRGLDVSGRATFRECLAARGHSAPRRPHWTRDDYGIRFERPYVTLTALFAEDFGFSPAAGRALGWSCGVVAPLALCAFAIVFAVRRRAPFAISVRPRHGTRRDVGAGPSRTRTREDRKQS